MRPVTRLFRVGSPSVAALPELKVFYFQAPHWSLNRNPPALCLVHSRDYVGGQRAKISILLLLAILIVVIFLITVTDTISSLINVITVFFFSIVSTDFSRFCLFRFWCCY